MIGGDKFFPSDLEKTRRAYERVIRKNAKNPEMYSDEPVIFKRLPDQHLSFFEELAEEVVADTD